MNKDGVNKNEGKNNFLMYLEDKDQENVVKDFVKKEIGIVDGNNIKDNEVVNPLVLDIRVVNLVKDNIEVV